MRITIKELEQKPVHLMIADSPRYFDLEDHEFSFVGLVQGEITARLIKKQVLVTGQLQVQARTECVRCLEPFELTLSVPVELVYEHDPIHLQPPKVFSIEDDIIYYFDGEVLDPREQLRELIMAELPHFPHCREACKGLCSHCGANLNRESCSCAQPEARPPADWKQQLKDLKLN